MRSRGLASVPALVAIAAMTGSSATAHDLMIWPSGPVYSLDSQSRGITPDPGVVGHDGKPFTATDAAFSLDRARSVRNSLGGFGKPVRPIAAIEIVDPPTLRPATTAPVPTLPGDLSFIAIVSDHAGRGATTARADELTLASGAQEAGR